MIWTTTCQTAPIAAPHDPGKTLNAVADEE